ncbi:cholesterol oxidase substrate-binding domain-containing protein [Streptomyces sp. NPDC002788]
MRTFDGGFALTRVEWSKGWAYTDDGVWRDPEVLGSVVPAAVGSAEWAEAVAVLDRLDQHGVYGNAFLDRLFA